jgi:hypothetical protein
MKVRILLALSAALLLSVGVATAGASTSSQALCTSNGGTYSTKASSSIFAPAYKGQGVLWTCNGYTGGATTSQALVTACLTNDGGKGITTTDGPPGDATCWVNPFTTQGQGICESNGGTYSADPKTSLFRQTKGQKVIWTCDGYSGGSTTSQALVTACLSEDGGQGITTTDGPPGDATCWNKTFT